MIKLLRLVVWAVVAAATILVLCGVYIGNLDYSRYFQTAKGKLTGSVSVPFKSDSLFVREWLSLTGDSGRKVSCGLLVPRGGDSTRRHPAVILLGGKATGKYAIDYVLDIKDVIIASPDYPYDPRDSYDLAEFISDVPKMRKAALGMVPSVRLVLDYLWQRPDVDTTRLVLLGYSFGAPFVPCIATYDRRVSVAAMVFGSGNLAGLIRHNVRRYKGALASDFAGLAGCAFLQPLEPLMYARRISPTPLIMINGTEDEQVPERFVLEFYSRVKTPKHLVWLKAAHVNPRNIYLTRRIVETLKAELHRLNILSDNG